MADPLTGLRTRTKPLTGLRTRSREKAKPEMGIGGFAEDKGRAANPEDEIGIGGFGKEPGALVGGPSQGPYYPQTLAGKLFYEAPILNETLGAGLEATKGMLKPTGIAAAGTLGAISAMPAGPLAAFGAGVGAASTAGAAWNYGEGVGEGYTLRDNPVELAKRTGLGALEGATQEALGQVGGHVIGAGLRGLGAAARYAGRNASIPAGPWGQAPAPRPSPVNLEIGAAQKAATKNVNTLMPRVTPAKAMEYSGKDIPLPKPAMAPPHQAGDWTPRGPRAPEIDEEFLMKQLMGTPEKIPPHKPMGLEPTGPRVPEDIDRFVKTQGNLIEAQTARETTEKLQGELEAVRTRMGELDYETARKSKNLLREFKQLMQREDELETLIAQTEEGARRSAEFAQPTPKGPGTPPIKETGLPEGGPKAVDELQPGYTPGHQAKVSSQAPIRSTEAQLRLLKEGETSTRQPAFLNSEDVTKILNDHWGKSKGNLTLEAEYWDNRGQIQTIRMTRVGEGGPPPKGIGLPYDAKKHNIQVYWDVEKKGLHEGVKDPNDLGFRSLHKDSVISITVPGKGKYVAEVPGKTGNTGIQREGAPAPTLVDRSISREPHPAGGPRAGARAEPVPEPAGQLPTAGEQVGKARFLEAERARKAREGRAAQEAAENTAWREAERQRALAIREGSARPPEGRQKPAEPTTKPVDPFKAKPPEYAQPSRHPIQRFGERVQAAGLSFKEPTAGKPIDIRTLLWALRRPKTLALLAPRAMKYALEPAVKPALRGFGSTIAASAKGMDAVLAKTIANPKFLKTLRDLPSLPPELKEKIGRLVDTESVGKSVTSLGSRLLAILALSQDSDFQDWLETHGGELE